MPHSSPVCCALQSLWKPLDVRRDNSYSAYLCYAFLFVLPTGIFTAAINSITYNLCDSADLKDSFGWFCDSKLLQFLFTVVLPFVLLMLWQNMVIPQNLYKMELKRGAAVSLSQMERNMLRIYFAWEVCNIFLGGILSSSLVRYVLLSLLVRYVSS